jgi:hypothetical protein
MKQISVVLFVLVFSVTLSAQLRWTGTWGGTNGENGTDVILDGNNLLICGSQKTAETIEDDILLLNISPLGVENWHRDTQVNLWDRANAIIPLSGGGFGYAGYRGAQSSTWDYVLGTTNAEGINNWVQTYGVGTKHEKAEALAQRLDGGFVVVGNNITDYQGWIVLTDANGTQTGTQTLNYTTETYAFDAITSPTGHILVVGTQKASSNADVLLVMLNVAGTEIWHHNLGGSNSHYGYCANLATDGYIIGGNKKSGTEYDLMLMKATEEGEMVWVQTYNVDAYEQFNDVMQTADGGFLAVGSTGNYTTKDWYILKTDALGVEEWHVRMGGTGNDECNGVVTLPDENYFLVGFTDSYGAGQTDVWMATVTPTGGVLTDEQVMPLVTNRALSCYPNPFSGEAKLKLNLTKGEKGTVSIYNIKGQKVRDLFCDYLAMCAHEIKWDAKDNSGNLLAPGVYFARYSNSTQSEVLKLLLMR